MLLRPTYIFLVPPEIMSTDGYPFVHPTFILLTCGQELTVPTLMGVEGIQLSCLLFSGSEPLILNVTKDNRVISNDFLVLLSPVDDDDFGIYYFSVSNECGSTLVWSSMLRQGQFLDFAL